MSENFDYIIIGGGLAGLQLALNFGKDRFFEQKTFGIIEPSPKTENDKTWCFWEEGKSEWDDLAYKTWDKGKFISSEKDIDLHLQPFSYKMIRSIDFYKNAKEKLNELPNFTFFPDEVDYIDEASSIVYGKKNSYNAIHIFDSRISSEYLDRPGTTTLFQHFKGWTIRTENSHFDPSVFTKMDFRLKYKDSTSFTYVLPVSEKEALVEFTFFTPYLTEETIYDEQLKKYIEEYLKITNYTIAETEKGVIPMTDFPFHEDSTPKITKIGTAGSWVKASSGYSFKNTEKKVNKIIENIKNGINPGEDLISKRHLFYDAVFLDVLFQKNELGEEIFEKLFSKNSVQEIFNFLDEETSTREEFKLMFSLFHPQFIKSFFRKIF